MENTKIDKVVTDVSEKINYEFPSYFLVKPLPVKKVNKEVSTPIAKGSEPKKDKNDISAIDYDEVKTEIKAVDSDFREGVVLKIPYEYNAYNNDNARMPINIGDVIIYKDQHSIWFDLLKDSRLIRPYDIIGKELILNDVA